MCLCEVVYGLGQKGHAFFLMFFSARMASLHGEGYHGSSQRVQTRDFLPQRRLRVWMVLWRGDLPNLADQVFKTLKTLQPEKVQCLRSFLSSSSDIVHVAPRRAPVRPGQKWLRHTRDFLNSVGEGTRVKAVFQACRQQLAHLPAFNTLTARQQANLVSQYVRLFLRFNVSAFRKCVIFQIDQSVFRTPAAIDSCPCVVPNGVYWLSRPGRLLTCEELASIQGIGVAEQKKLHRLHKQSIGNAFPGPVLGGLLLSVLHIWPTVAQE